jgi:hypothetical protein
MSQAPAGCVSLSRVPSAHSLVSESRTGSHRLLGDTMRNRLLASALIATTAVPSSAFAADWPPELVRRTAVNTAAPTQSWRELDWAQLTRKPPGSVVELRTATAAVRKLVILRTTPSSLTALDLGDPRLTGSARRLLRHVATRNPDLLVDGFGGHEVVSDAVRINDDGLYDNGRKLADRADLIVQLARTEVSEWRSRGSFTSETIVSVTVGIAAAAALSFWLWVLTVRARN